MAGYIRKVEARCREMECQARIWRGVRGGCSVKKLHLKGKPQEGAAAQSILDFPEVQGENFHKTGNTIYL